MTISELYKKSADRGVLKAGMTEQQFRDNISTEEGLRSYYDYATTKGGMKFHDYDVFKERIGWDKEFNAQSTTQPTAQATATSQAPATPKEEKKGGLVSPIMSPHAAAYQAAENFANQQQKDQAERERINNAQLHVTDNDRQREKDLQQLNERINRDAMARNEYAQQWLPEDVKKQVQAGREEHIEGLKQVRDELQGQRAKYMDEPKTLEEAFENYATAWTQNTEEGKAALQEVDDVRISKIEQLKTEFYNTKTAIDIFADVEDKYQKGNLTFDEANEELNKRLNTAFINEYEDKIQQVDNERNSTLAKRVNAADNGWLKRQKERILEKGAADALDENYETISNAIAKSIEDNRAMGMTIGNAMGGSAEMAAAQSLMVPPELKAALQLYQEAETLLYDTKKGEGNFFTFGKEIARHSKNKFRDLATFGGSTIADAAVQANVLKKIAEEGAYEAPEKVLSENEMILYDAIVTELAVELVRKDNRSYGAMAGQMTAEMIPFVRDIAVGKGLFGGLSAAAEKGLMRGIVKSIGTNKFGKLLVNAGKTGINFAESAVMAAISPATIQKALQNEAKIDQSTLQLTDTGWKITKIDTKGKGLAYWDAVKEQVPEYFTETGGVTQFAANIVKSSRFGKFVAGSTFGQLAKALDSTYTGKFLNQTAYNGVWQEWGEELENTFYQAVKAAHNAEDGKGVEAFKNTYGEFFSPETQVPMLLSFSLPAILGGTVGTAQAISINKKYDKAYDQIMNRFELLGYDKEEREDLLNTVLAKVYNADVVTNAGEGRALRDYPKAIREAAMEIIDSKYGKEPSQRAQDSYAMLLADLSEYIYADQNLSAIQTAHAKKQRQVQGLIREIEATEQQIQNNTHTDGMMYHVNLNGQAGYVVSGAMQLNTYDNAELPVAMNNDVVTVRMEDGSVKQVAARDVQLLEQPQSAEGAMEFERRRLTARMNNLDRFKVGDVIYMTENGQPIDGNSSRVVDVTDEGIVAEIIDPNGQPNTTVIPHEVAESGLSTSDELVEDGVESVVLEMNNGSLITMQKTTSGDWMQVAPKDDSMTLWSQEDLDEFIAKGGAKIVNGEQAPSLEVASGNGVVSEETGEIRHPISNPIRHPQADQPAKPYATDEQGNPAWAELDVEQSVGALLSEMEDDKELSKQFAQSQIAAAKSALNKANKRKPQATTDLAAFRAEAQAIKQEQQAAQAELSKWENILLGIANYKTAEEQAAAEQAAAQAAAVRAQRKQTIEGVGGTNMAERLAASPRIDGNAGSITAADGTKIPGHYVLVSANALTPSHNPNANFAPSEGYPTVDGQSINDRDYQADQEEQAKVQQVAQTYDGRAITNMPIVSDEGLVYSGNGRTMAGQLAAANGTDGAYTEALLENATQFGFTAEQVESVPNARVVFMTDERLPYNTTTLALFNQNEQQTQSNTASAAANVRKLTPEAVGHIIAAVQEFDTVDAFFGDSRAPFELVNRLIADGIISERDKAAFVDNGRLTATGKDRLTALLFGTAFDEKTIRLLGDNAKVRNSVMRALPQILENKGLGDFSLFEHINNAIQAIYDMDTNKMSFFEFTRQIDIEGKTASDKYTAFELLLVDEMVNGGVQAFRDVLSGYNARAKESAGGQMDLFTGEVLTTEELTKQILQEYEQREANERGGAQPESAVAGTSESEKTITDSVASEIIEQITAEAEEFEDIELTADNWIALFGEGGTVETPIGRVKMGEGQFLKLMQKGRDTKLGMIKPTLERPSIIIEDKSKAKEGQIAERDFSYVFVKAFTGKNGERMYYFTSVTVQKDNQEVVVSNQEKERSRIMRLLKDGKLAYINQATLPSDTDISAQGDQLTNPVGGVSADKGTKNVPTTQEKTQKSVEEQQKSVSSGKKASNKTEKTQGSVQNSAQLEQKTVETEQKNAESNEKTQNVGKNAQEAAMRIAKAEADMQEFASKLGAQGVHLISDKEQLPNEEGAAYRAIRNGANVMGWYNPKTNQVYIYLPNANNLQEVYKTLLHEFVAHKGLRDMLGKEKFDQLCHDVWDMMSEQDKLQYALYVKNNTAVGSKAMQELMDGMTEEEKAALLSDTKLQLAAADEYMAHFAETGVSEQDRSIWQRIVDMVRDLLRKAGINLRLTDADIARLLYESSSRLSSDMTMRERSQLIAKNNKVVENIGNLDLKARLNDDVMFKLGTQVADMGDNTLVGLHNLSATKLRKAIKQGGLANPSAAVIDIAKQDHEQYGEISLIMPSSLVDSATGQNAGTYTGDIWSPTYPYIERKMNSKGTDKYYETINKVFENAPVGIKNRTQVIFVNMLDNQGDPDNLAYWYMLEKGIAPTDVIINSGISDDIKQRFEPLRDKHFVSDMNAEERGLLLSLAAELEGKTTEDLLQEAQGAKARYEAVLANEKASGFSKRIATEAIDEIDTYGVRFNLLSETLRKINEAIDKDGGVNVNASIGAAVNYVQENGLKDDFDSWLSNLDNRFGIEEVIFDGYNRNGDRKYIKHTLENASRIMNQQPIQNASSHGGLSATRGQLVERMSTLAQIRANKHRLAVINEYEDEQWKAMQDEWFNKIINPLSNMQQIDSNHFINMDIAEQRLLEAIMKKDPIAHLNREYGYSIAKDSEFAKSLKDLMQRLKELPSKYFETKFKRPVYLNEFVSAVVPQNLSQDLKDGLANAGVELYEYDEAQDGSRREATLQATEADGVRFRIGYDPMIDRTITPDAAQEMAEIKANAERNGTYLKTPNGADTKLTPRQWLQVRTQAFKEWFGDWELAATQIRIVPVTKRHSFNTKQKEVDLKKDVKAFAVREGIVATLTDKQTGGKGIIDISPKSINKMVDDAYQSPIGIDKHLDVLLHIHDIIKDSVYGEEHLGYAKNENDERDPNAGINKSLTVIRYFGAVDIDGATYRVKTTVKKTDGREKQKAYTYEITEIELLDGITTSAKAESPSSNNSISGAKLLQNVESSKQKGKKLLDFSQIVDENGEPMVVYHGTPRYSRKRFFAFNTNNGAAWFTPAKRYAEVFAESDQDAISTLYETYISMHNPANVGNIDTAVTTERLNTLAYGLNIPLVELEECVSKIEDVDYLWNVTQSKPFADLLKKYGYDGIQAKEAGVNSYGVFTPNQIKSATENVGTFDDSSDDIRFRISNENQRIFVSNAEKAVEGIKQEKATPQQWLAMLEKNGGIKAGEDKWLGLSEWLKEQNKKSITKQEILDFISENQIQIEEVAYSAKPKDEVFEEYKKEFRDYYFEAQDNGAENPQDVAWERMIEDHGEDFGLGFWAFGPELQVEEDSDYNDWEYENKTNARPINETRLDYTTEGLENKREIALTVPTIESWNEGDEVHFGDAGGGRAVAWVRFGETIDEDGSKILVIDEIQSKRHQEGREKGYKASIEKLQSAHKAFKDVEYDYLKHIDFIVNKYSDKGEFKLDYGLRDIAPEEAQKYRELQDSYTKLGREYDKLNYGVPSAPFDKNWHELAMKRMLRYAAENGFDKVAWTTGAQQAERYDIGDTIESLEASDWDINTYISPNPTKYIEIEGKESSEIDFYVDKEGRIYAPSHNFIHEEDRLSDVVGKELAVQILQDGHQTFDLDNARIGGEGMKGFYDKMLPSFVSKYVKKWGAKVGEVTMPQLQEGYQTMHSVDITPEMKESVMEGQTMFRITEEENRTPLTEAQQLIFDGLAEVAADAGLDVTVGISQEEAIKKMSSIDTEIVELLWNSPLKVSVVSSEDGAKVLKNIETAKEKYKNEKINSKNIVSTLGKIIGSTKENGSQYARFETVNGQIITIRISNHNANVSNFDNHKEEEGISIVISRKPNNGITNDGTAHVIEFFYSDKKLNQAPGTPIADILQSLEQTLYSGEYKDTTGIAEVEEVNGIELLRNPINGTILGYAQGNRIVLTKEGMTPETVVHEYTHVWAKAMQRNNRAGWENIIEIFKQSPLWNVVKNDPNYQDLKTDDAICSEVLARFSGKQGAERLDEVAREFIYEEQQKGGSLGAARVRQFINHARQAIKSFWKWVGKNLFGITKFDSMEDVADRVLYDLLNATELGVDRSDTTIESSIEMPSEEFRAAMRAWNATNPRPIYDGIESVYEYGKRLSKWTDARDNYKRYLVNKAIQEAKDADPITEPLKKLELVKPNANLRTSRDVARELTLRNNGMVVKELAEETAELLNKHTEKADILYKRYVDAMKPVEDLEDLIVKMGGKVDGTNSAYKDSFAANGRSTDILSRYERSDLYPLAKTMEKMIEIIGKDTGMKWQNIEELYLKDDKRVNGSPITTRRLIGLYAQAKDIIEAEEMGLPDRGRQGFVELTGATPEEVVTKIETAIPAETIDNFWKYAKRSSKFSLDYLLEAGSISQETYNEVKDRKYYVPQRGWGENDLHDDEPDYVQNQGKTSKSGHDAALIKAKGRQSLASDPFQHIWTIAQTSVISAENNKIKQKALQLVLDNQELGEKSGLFTMHKVYYINEIDPTTGKVKRDANGDPIVKETYTEPSAEDFKHDKKVKEKIKDIRKNTAKRRKALERELEEHGDTNYARALQRSIDKAESDITELEDTFVIAYGYTSNIIERKLTKAEKDQHRKVLVFLIIQDFIPGERCRIFAWLLPEVPRNPKPEAPAICRSKCTYTVPGASSAAAQSEFPDASAGTCPE